MNINKDTSLYLSLLKLVQEVCRKLSEIFFRNAKIHLKNDINKTVSNKMTIQLVLQSGHS